MERSENVPNNECGLTTQSSVVPFNDFDDSTTQDAQHFCDDSNQSITDAAAADNDDPDKMNSKPRLAVRISNCFTDFRNAAILSPISDLAMNVAKTKLNRSNSYGK